jgi:hypothetical protein
MGWPSWVEDMRVVVVGDGRTEEKAYRIDSEKHLPEHVDVLLNFNRKGVNERTGELLSFLNHR